MPVADLPPSAQGMYSTWWTTVQAWANQVNPDTGRAYSVTDVSAAASQLAREFPSQFPAYSPPGVSSLFSQALSIVNARNNLAAADPAAAIDASMVARPPWSATDAEMAAAPRWQVRSEVTYTTSEGTTETGIFTSKIENILPSSVGALAAVVEYQVASMLAAPPGTGTPRSGDLLSVDSITLLAV